MAELIVAGMLGLIIGVPILWNKVRPWYLARVPKGWSLGPIINGKSRTVNVKLTNKNPPSFNFPFPDKEAGHVHALLYKGDKPKNTITLKYRIDAEDSVTFHPQETPDEAATISIMIKKNGDSDYSSTGEEQYYRLYCPVPDLHQLKAGEYTLTTKLTPEGWCGVNDFGVTEEHMNSALNDLNSIQVCFGSQGGRAHGVYSSGPAKFTLVSFELT